MYFAIFSIYLPYKILIFIYFGIFQIYAKVAVFLTNIENPRTQTEYEDSYTFKIFFFEFINFYSSLIYIAFFKVLTFINNPLFTRIF